MDRHEIEFPRLALSKHTVFHALILFFLCFTLLSACGGMPSGGPSGGSFDSAKWEYEAVATDANGKETLPFVLVNVDANIISSLTGVEDKTYFKGAFTDRSPPTDAVLGVGDIVRVTIFEAGPGGLFVPAGGAISGGNFITLPDQEVDQSGRISVPYAGKDNSSGYVSVKGRKLIDVQNDIQKRLINKALEPQVLVTTVKRSSNLFSVMGEVNSPGRFNLEHGGVRILDALSVAGGPKHADYNTLVTLQRGETSATARLSTLLTETENNIFVKPSDLIAVKKDERYYNVLGATETNNRIPFESEDASVADAIAKAGGLNKDVAEPSTVVVFRREESTTLDRMGVKLEGHEGQGVIPTVYRLNLGEPSGMFLAQKMQLRNNDVVYVSTHPFHDIEKIIGVLRDALFIKLID
jgi:polysaccharide export outer membrane protein